MINKNNIFCSYSLFVKRLNQETNFPTIMRNNFPRKILFCKFVCNCLQHLDTCPNNFFISLSIHLFIAMRFHIIVLSIVSFFVLQLIKMIFAFDIDTIRIPTFSIIIFVLLIYHVFCLFYVLCPPHHVTLGLNYHYLIQKNYIQ